MSPFIVPRISYQIIRYEIMTIMEYIYMVMVIGYIIIISMDLKPILMLMIVGEAV